MNSVLVILFILNLFLQAGMADSTPQQVAPSPKYSFSSTQVFQTASYYGTTNNTINPLIYTITFPKAMNDSSYRSGIAIQQIYAQIPSNRFNITFILNAKNSANLKFNMFSNTMDVLQSLTIRYLIIASNWGTLSFYWFQDSASSALSSSTSYSFTRTGLSSVNMTGVVNSFSCLTGFDVTSTTAANELSLILSVTRASATSISGTLSSQSLTPINVGYFSFNLLSYNQGEINALPAKITFGFFSSNSPGALKYRDTQQILRQYNTLFGLTGFYIKNEAYLSWNGTLTINTSIDISSNNNFLYFQFIYIILQENWCIQATPYLLIATATCYDICPNGYYSNDVGLSCEICLYDCYQCTNSTACSVCNATTDNRQMNTSTVRCDPLPGYYDDGLSHIVALGCDANCQTCLATSTNCQSCNNGKYLSATYQSPNKTACLQCAHYDCETCNAYQNCLSCSNQSHRVLDALQLRCLPQAGYYDDGTNQIANPCDAECLTCSAAGNNSCLSCKENATLISNSCKSISASDSANTQSKSLKLLQILLPLLFGLLLCCFGIFFCIWRYRKNQKSKVQGQNQAQIQNADQKTKDLNEIVQVQSLLQLKDDLDQNTIYNKNIIQRGDQNKRKKKYRKRKTAPREQTEENVASFQEFKDILQVEIPQNQRKTEQSLKNVDVNLLILYRQDQPQVTAQSAFIKADQREKPELQNKFRRQLRDQFCDSNLPNTKQHFSEKEGSRER